MQKPRLERLAPLTGAIAAALALAGSVGGAL